MNNEVSCLSLKELTKKAAEYHNDPIFIESLCRDTRTSAAQLGRRLFKQLESAQSELIRLEKMREYENRFPGKIVAGCDEAGRGPLAGPVVACVVILDFNQNIPGLNDSKQLSRLKREQLYEIIISNCIDYGVGIIDNDTIDEINILQATYQAVILAYQKLKTKPDILLTDALNIKKLNVHQVPIIKGDCKSVSISAASILAKVTRDKIMNEIHKEFPLYNFDKNKGYGTKEHIDLIKKRGIISAHRKTFVKNFIEIDDNYKLSF
ncbi:ribonuclease HII [Candidatus Dependentiae bacterium]|nr:ribonuclease HII [Candidatus Dependentiae bacterium]